MEKMKHLCPLPWMHLSFNTDSSARVCCNTDHGGHIRDEQGGLIHLRKISSVASVMNLPFMRDLRRAMLAGERPEFCRSCHKIEDAGGASVRQIYRNIHKDKIKQFSEGTQPDGEIDPRVIYLDLSLSNQCNLKCRMCNPVASHALKADFDALAFEYHKEFANLAHSEWKMAPGFTNLIEQVLPTLEELLTTGGEPFLSAQHVYFLERAVAQGYAHKILLRYHTNLTVLPPRLLELWRNFRAIEVHTSIEAAGPLNDYIRFPSSWPVVENNLRSLVGLKKQLPLWIEVHTCFQAYNVLRIPELLEFLLDMDDDLPMSPYFILLDTPSILAADVLPMHLRVQARDRIEKCLKRNSARYAKSKFSEFTELQVRNLRVHLAHLLAAPSSPERFAQFISYSEKLDAHRGQSIYEHLPELRTLDFAGRPAGSEIFATQGGIP